MGILSRSSVYRENNNGPKTDSSGPPTGKSTKPDFVSLQRTPKDLSQIVFKPF